MPNPIADRPGRRPDPLRLSSLLPSAVAGDVPPLDEDAAPWAAAALADVTDAVPVGATADVHPFIHAGRVAGRAAVLVVIVALAYLPVFWAAGLLDGEADNYRNQPLPTMKVGGWASLPLSLVSGPLAPVRGGGPPLLRVLIHSESWLGTGALTHHTCGLLVHAGVAMILWLVLRRIGRPGAWLAAAAFAVDPGSAAAVLWLGLRGRLWGGLLALAAVWLLLRAAGVPPKPHLEPADYDPDEVPRTWRRRVLSVSGNPLAVTIGLLLLLAAALCQPAAAAAAGGIAILLVAWQRPTRLRPIDLTWVVPVLVVAAAAAIATLRLPTPAEPDRTVAGLSDIVRPLWWTGHALERVAWPLASADLARAVAGSPVWVTVGIGAAFWVTLAGLVLARRRLGAGPAVAAGCVALLLPTVSVPPSLRAVPGLAPARQVEAAATYLIAIPILVLLADGAVAAARRVFRTHDLLQRATEVVVAVVAVLGLGALTVVRSAAFADTETVLKTAVRVNGRGSWDDRSRLAEWDLSHARPDAALSVLAGLTPTNCPDAPTALTEGHLLAADGDQAGAVAWFRLAARLDPTAVDPIVDEARTYVAQHRVGEAIDVFEHALATRPPGSPGLARLLDAFGEQLLDPRVNDLSLAEKEFRLSITADPEVAATHVDLGNLLAMRALAIRAAADRPGVTGSGASAKPAVDLLNEAAQELRAAVALDPENYDAYHSAGVILHALGDNEKSARLLFDAVGLRPDLSTAHNDLAVALAGIGKFRLAEFHLQEALRLQPDYAAAKQNLDVVRKMAAARQAKADIEGK